MSAGSDGGQDGVVYDGQTARPWPVRALCGPKGLTLRPEDEDTRPDIIPWKRLVLLEQRSGRTVLGHSERPGWRLVLGEALPAAYRARLGQRGSEVHSRRPLARRPLIWVMAAAITALVLIGIMGSQIAARLVPERAARHIGNAIVAQLAPPDRVCRAPAADAAIKRLARRLAPPGFDPDSLSVTVANHALVNAFTAPGGRIVILHGLIERVDGPDALAGVLAHEIGHAAHRHPLQAQMRTISLSFVLRAFGGDVGSLVDTFGGLRFSRSMEREADATARAALARQWISPEGLAGFFDDLAENQATAQSPVFEMLGYISTHPDPIERAAGLRDELSEKTPYRPALTESEWSAIKAMCSESPATEEQSDTL